MLETKKCFKCGSSLPITEFYKHSKMSDGVLSKCKTCTKRDVRENRLQKIDYYRAYDLIRAKRPERMKSAAAQAQKWRSEDRRRMKCHNAVVRAIRKGTLHRKICEWPGCESEKSLAHHESYDKPLDVIFYCQPHHKARHKKMKQEGIEP